MPENQKTIVDLYRRCAETTADIIEGALNDADLVMVIGPTASGKTAALRVLADRRGVKMLCGNATSTYLAEQARRLPAGEAVLIDGVDYLRDPLGTVSALRAWGRKVVTTSERALAGAEKYALVTPPFVGV